jgi:H(+)-transporting ATP synthase subunit D
MSQPSKTRAELLKRERRMELAAEGRDLLEDKEAALIRELKEVAEEFRSVAADLEAVAKEARTALARANAYAGDHVVRAAAAHAEGDIELRMETTSTMGVTLPSFRPEGGLDEAPPHEDVTVEEAAEAFRQWLRAILRMAEVQLRVKRLTEEIKTTSRRKNALEHRVMPRLEREHDSIEQAISERERAERARLKLARDLRSE